MKAQRNNSSIALIAILFVQTTFAWSADDFNKTVAPILASKCLECHSGNEPKGGLDLSTRANAMKGGESGAAINGGKLDKSILWQRVRNDEMPPKHPISKAEKEVLKRWIADGAKWDIAKIDRFAYTTDSRAGYDWWSLQPIREVKALEVGDDPSVRTSIDAFVRKTHDEKGFSTAPLADPRTQVRRLYFDLIGLPPSPEVVDQFAKNPTDEAYAKIVEDLLMSHRYGERWGRHWLDVVRFGESNGFERNGPRYNFWPYRDWVINAFNNDMPYDEFVRMQLIGDQLKPGREGSASVGFLVAGVHNTVVGGSERMKKLAFQDELEEVIGVIGQTFLGLTVNCSRCHDHKFDPIKQTEYYQLISSISGMTHGERVAREPSDVKRLAKLNDKNTKLSTELAAIDQEARQAILKARKSGEVKLSEPPKALARWEFDGNLKDSIGGLHGEFVGNAKFEEGAIVVDGKSFVRTAKLPKAIAEKTLEVWVQLSTLDQGGGGAITLQTPNGIVFDSIVYAEREKRKWMAGSNGFVRTESFSAFEETEALKRPVHMVLVYSKDGRITGYRDGQPYGRPIRKTGLQSYSANQSEVLFGLRHGTPGGNHMLKARIFRASLYDRALTPEEVLQSASSTLDFVSEKQIIASLDKKTLERRNSLDAQLSKVQGELKTLTSAAQAKLYTMNPRTPVEIRFLQRGDIEKEGDIMTPGAVASVKGVDADFELNAKASDADRRRKLAEWITSPNNPLFARVIVNRIWQYHFGTGIVVTPSDFGFNGGQPSFPDLLDHLATELKENGYRLKALHRKIVTSTVYRQGADLNEASASKDADNRYLWRMQPRRLEAESVRDAILSVSGKLNLQMGGPGFHDVSVIPNNGTTYYEAIDVDGDAFFRRTIYRFTPRGGRSALLDTFDCPDPATTAPRRAITTTPLQALSLLNNAFVLRMSKHFAARVAQEGKNVDEQVDRAWRLALARSPSKAEHELSKELVQKHGLPALCRGLFNANEFVIVE
ncbi:MAG: hypothetical protein CMJ78_13140 [Planctomycetaceae bacterium]|nr:hypothetical protein [Planctomycetaceae bacterium]